MSAYADRGGTMAERIGVRELRARLPEVLRRAREGTAFVVTSRGQVIAELGPPRAAEPARRRPGAMKGQIWMAPDFDETPEDIIAAMEGDED